MYRHGLLQGLPGAHALRVCVREARVCACGRPFSVVLIVVWLGLLLIMP